MHLDPILRPGMSASLIGTAGDRQGTSRVLSFAETRLAEEQAAEHDLFFSNPHRHSMAGYPAVSPPPHLPPHFFALLPNRWNILDTGGSAVLHCHLPCS